jgi:hypothetical protein
LANPIFLHLFVITIGVLFNFFGGKFFRILHGLVCGLFFMLFTMLIIPTFPLNLIIGMIVAGLGGYQCYEMKKFQAFILAAQLGLLVGILISAVILPNGKNVFLSIPLTISLAIFGGWFGMRHAKKVISFCCTIIGSCYMASGSMGLFGYNFGMQIDGFFFLGLGLIAVFIVAGRHYQ